MTTANSTVTGAGLASLAGQDTVVKIGSRWYWLISLETSDHTRCDFAWVVPQANDPRVHQLGNRKLRVVYRDYEYQTRPRERPVWEWVTRRIEALA